MTKNAKARKAKADGIPAPVAAAFRAYAPAMRAKLMRLRGIILKTAAKMDGVGGIEETGELRRRAERHANLVAYADRMLAQYYPDFAKQKAA